VFFFFFLLKKNKCGDNTTIALSKSKWKAERVRLEVSTTRSFKTSQSSILHPKMTKKQLMM